MTGTRAPGGVPLRIDDVAVRYAGTDRNAVDGVTLDVPAGALVVLLGPSGCGKSTLLRTLNRLIAPDRGSVRIGDRDVSTVDPTLLRRGIGYVIQAIGLFPHMNVAANVAIVPQLLGWSPARVAARVDELLSLVRLEPQRYRGRLPRELSGGEAQRVGVARALAAEPPLLLMDEPFGAVDAIVRTALQDELVRIHGALGTTILFVTHDVDEALRIADRLIVMNAGRVVQYDSPLHVLAKPATEFVAALFDARDGVRRLGLLRVSEAMRPPSSGATGDATIASDATLRAALNAFLEGAHVLTVRDGERTVGTLEFNDVRAAIAAA